MNNVINFDAIFADVGMSAAQMLNWLEAPSGPRVPPVRFAWGGCFAHFTPGEATACHADAEECEDPNEYPFAGIGSDFGPSNGNVHEGYIGNVWQAVDDRAAALMASQVHPVSMAVAIAYQAPLMSSQVGQAYFPLLELEPNNSKAMFGAAVVVAPDGLGAADNEAIVDFTGRRIAHELGHTFGLGHDTAPSGFMNATGGTVPIVDWEADSLLQILGGDPPEVVGFRTQEFAWTEYAPGKWAPRPSGFGHTPCTNDSECDNGHPELHCRSGWCVY
jgi:hypothetical protein